MWTCEKQEILRITEDTDGQYRGCDLNLTALGAYPEDVWPIVTNCLIQYTDSWGVSTSMAWRGFKAMNQLLKKMGGRWVFPYKNGHPPGHRIGEHDWEDLMLPTGLTATALLIHGLSAVYPYVGPPPPIMMPGCAYGGKRQR